MAQLKQQLKESEVNREELSAELKEYSKIKVEPGVSGTEDWDYTKCSVHAAILSCWILLYS